MYAPVSSRARAERVITPPRSALLIYAIVLAPGRMTLTSGSGLLMRGVEDSPVSPIQEGDIVALVSELRDRRCLSMPSCADILAFDAVLERFGAVHTLLPVRFGSTAQDEESVRELLRVRGQEYRHALMELDGCAEMCVRILPRALQAELVFSADAAAPRADAGGRREQVLNTRRQHLDRVYSLANRYLGYFSELVLRHRIDYQFSSSEKDERDGYPVLSIHFLIQRGLSAAFQEACRSLTQLCQSNVLLSGPSLPVSFAPSLPFVTAR